MGFNNGYDSGYEDAKAEFAARENGYKARIAKLEAEIAGGGSGGGGSGGGGSGGGGTPIGPLLRLDTGLVMGEIVWDDDESGPQYSGLFRTLTTEPVYNEDLGETMYQLTADDVSLISESGQIVYIVTKVPERNGVHVSDSYGNRASTFFAKPGIYILSDADGFLSFIFVAPLDAIVPSATVASAAAS